MTDDSEPNRSYVNLPMIPKDLATLSGDELLLPSATVKEFWRWALGDLRDNTNRGLLAQFLVARAVGDTRMLNVSWDDYDVRSPEGIRIEVKSSAYLQSWRQTKLSKIIFSGLRGQRWSDLSGYGDIPEVRADVFVFAVQTCLNHDLYDPLDLASWQFYVLPGSVIRQLGHKSLGLNRIAGLAPAPVDWYGLRTAVLSSERVPTDPESPSFCTSGCAE